MEKSHFNGIIGAILGALIASIPWIITYVYLNMILSVLSIIIAIGALKGYQIFNGKIDKKLPIIITIISLFTITVVTLIIIPCLLLIKRGPNVSFVDFQILYSSKTFLIAILKDYFISVIFTFLGISGVIKNIKKQINENKTIENIKIDFSNGNNKKDKEYLKNIFVSQNALSEVNAIYLNDENINQDTLNLLITQGIIIKVDDKYYYREEKENKINKNNKIAIWVLIIIFTLCFSAVIFLSKNDKSIDKNDNEKINEPINNSIKPLDKDFNYTVPNEYEEYYIDNVYYYIPKIDLTGKSGSISIDSFESDLEYSEDFLNETANTFTQKYEYTIKSKEYYKSPLYNCAKFELQFDNYTEIIYYILTGYRLVIVEAIDYNLYPNLQKDLKTIVDSIEV